MQSWPPWAPSTRNWKNSTIHFRKIDFRSVKNWNNLQFIAAYAFLKKTLVCLMLQGEDRSVFVYSL